MKKINLRNLKSVPKKSRHVRWNSEQSPDNFLFLRYHVVVVGDKKLKQVVEKIYRNLGRITGGIDEKRRVEGKVANSKLRYLLVSFDSPLVPEIAGWRDLNLPVILDDDLYERKTKGLSIEFYVEGFYS